MLQATIAVELQRRDRRMALPVNCSPFFIVGSGRSGTTLLRLILASHSRLSIPPETWFLLPLLRRLKPGRPLSAMDLDYALRTITHHYRWPDMQIPADEFRRRVAAFAEPSLRDVAEVIYQEYMRRDRKSRWGDKTPGYIEVVPQLAGLFPGSCFIHLRRDGRDVVKSFQRTGWYGPWLHANTQEWNTAEDYYYRWKCSDFKQQILDISYEDLVLNTERTVRRICRFLDEEFEPEMLAWQPRVDGLVPAREIAIHEKLRRSPLAGDVDRWRREMSAREIFVCEAFIGKRLERAGYERMFRSPAWVPVFQLTRWYCIAGAAIAGLLPRILRALHRRGWRQPADSRRARGRE